MPSIEALDVDVHDYGPISEASAREKMIATTCIMMAEPKIATTRTIHREHRTPGAPKSATKRVSEVQIISLRVQHARDYADGEASDDSSSLIERTHRWMVAGHWRNQPCGPRQSQRRPVWVMPHLKGPDGAPIRERVHAWRR